MPNSNSQASKRRDHRIILHFDYDCFYAAVFEREDPKLRHLPFAVQQKQIIVTCNYEARRRGLHKLQLVKDVKKKCPDCIIALGEDLTRFRNASKDLYRFLRSYVWSSKAERLGFDEVWLDVTDMIDYNMDILNRNNLSSSFFHLDRNNPTTGFAFDASECFGQVFPTADPTSASPPPSTSTSPSASDELGLRLVLGSHLAQHIRHQLEEQKGYTSTVGISTNKTLSKLVGNVNKPKGQTTLIPPYTRSDDDAFSNVSLFLDTHDVGKVPGIGFKTAQKIRHHILQRPAAFDGGLVYGGTKERVTVGDVRLHDGLNAEILERLLAGPGVPKGLGEKIWGLIYGADDSEVGKAKDAPQQISIEDSYIKLNTMPEVKKQMTVLSISLIKRMRIDLTEEAQDDDILTLEEEESKISRSAVSTRRWIAHPRTLRLTTRPRPPRNPDGSRPRLFNRISKSSDMPSFIFNLNLPLETLAGKLVDEALLPLFRQLHPEKEGWDLSLVNVGATNMNLAAGETKEGAGRDIGKMFRRQDDVLKDWKIADLDMPPSQKTAKATKPRLDTESPSQREDEMQHGSEDAHAGTQESFVADDGWEDEDETTDASYSCPSCGAAMPSFAISAHQRFHSLPD